MHYSSWQTAILGVSWSLLAAAILVVVLRLFIRARLQSSSLGWDDWTIVVAVALSIGASAVSTKAMQLGLALHLSDVVRQDRPELNSLVLIWGILNTLGITFIKISVCIFLLRLVSRTNRTRRIVKWLVAINMTIAVPVTLAMCAVIIAQLIPVSQGPSVLGNKRFSPATITTMLKVVSATIGVTTDFTTASIPIFIVCRLKMPRYQKFQASGILALGFVVGAFSIVKTVDTHWTVADWSYSGSHVVFWGSIECNFGIMVASLPTLRSLTQCFQPRVKSNTSSKLRQGTGHTSNDSRRSSAHGNPLVQSHADYTVDGSSHVRAMKQLWRHSTDEAFDSQTNIHEMPRDPKEDTGAIERKYSSDSRSDCRSSRVDSINGV